MALSEQERKLVAQFGTLANRAMREQRVKFPDPKKPVDPAVEEANRMAEAARAPLTRKKILPWLTALQHQAAASVRRAASQGSPATNYAAGYEAALNDVLVQLELWAETHEAPENEARPLRPLEQVN